MKVIFRENVRPYKKDDIVEVKDGYARNFLLPKKLAVPVNKENLEELNTRKANEAERNKEKIDMNKSIAEKLDTISFTFKLKKNEKGKAIGSVTNKDIADKVNELLPIGTEIKAGSILPKKFDTFGEFVADIKLYKVDAHVHIIIAEED